MKNKIDECRDCIYFQEYEEEIMKKGNSGYDMAFDMLYFVKNCNKCEEKNESEEYDK